MQKRGEISVKKILGFFVVFVAIVLALSFVSILKDANGKTYLSPPVRADAGSSAFIYSFFIFVLFLLIVLFLYRLVKVKKNEIEN